MRVRLDDDPTMFQVIAQWATETPDAPALTFGDRIWTYDDVVREAEEVATGLRAAGIAPGDRVAVFAANHPAVVVTWLAGARNGIVPSVVNQFLKPPELAWILEHLGARGVVTDAEHLDTVRAALASAGLEVPIWSLDGVADGVESYDALRTHGRDPGSHPDPGDVLEVTYTSGTAGNPKGAVFDHRAHLYQCDAVATKYRMDRDTVEFSVMPLFHAGGLRNAVLTVLMRGGHVIIGEFSLSSFWDDIRRYGVTHITAIDTISMLLLKQPPSPDDANNPVRVAMGVGTPEVLNAFENRFDLDYIQAYGMTECGIVCTTPDEPREVIQQARLQRPGNNYVGRPLGDRTEVRIVDDEGRDVAEGEIGEFLVRSPGMLREYFADSEGTREILRDGWLHTGDLAYKAPDGSLFFIDRKKDMIRRSGENIAPKQIEDVLHAHPGVRQATVIPVPDELRGQAVKAIVVPVDREKISADELWAWCDQRLAHYKVPRYIEFRDAIPMNASNKVLKAKLREQPIEGDGDCFDRGDVRYKDVRTAQQAQVTTSS